MILVDSSVWVDFFRGVPTRQVSFLVEHISTGDVAVGDLIVCEVLQGFGSARIFERARLGLEEFSMIGICGEVAALQAARNYRVLRAKGITVRKTIDTLIATRCILDHIPLLYSDRDFDPFVEYLGLVPALDRANGVN